MAKSKKQDEKVYSQNTVIIVATVCILAGFIGGITVSAIKTTGRMPPQQAIPPQASQQQPNVQEKSGELDALIKETAQNPENAKAWVDLGNLYFDSDQFQKSVWAYKKSLEIQPQNANVWTDMGVMYRRLGQPQEALKAFDEAARIDPRHEQSRFNKGIVLLHDLNDPEGAIKAWEDLLKTNPFAMAPNGQTVDELVTQFKKNLKKQ